MKKIMFTTISFVFMTIMSFSQQVIETYDVSKDKQTTVIVRDQNKSDKDILDELDLDDYTVGEEVYITAEMWEKIQKEQEAKKVASNPIKEKVVYKESKTAVAPAAKVEVTKEEVIEQEDVQEKVVEKSEKTTTKKKTTSSTAKKKKSKKAKKYRYKKPKKAKRRRIGRRSSKTTCYSF